MAYCNGVCVRFKSRTLEESRLRYAHGDRWCCYCSVFMKWSRRDCPCCRTRLRTRPVKRRSVQLLH